MKTIKFIILISIGIAFFSCEKESSDNDDNTPELKLTKSGEVLVKSGNNFGFEILDVLNQSAEPDENLFISPLSISFAFGMVLNGAEGDTYNEIAQTFHFGDLTREQINENFEAIVSSLKDIDNNVVMDIANSIWNREGFPVKQDFINVNKEYFDAEVQTLDFSNTESVDIINNWVKDKTNDKIEQIINYIPSDAVMYLINAIYFNGTWKYEFDEEHTEEGDFYLGDGNVYDETLFMKQEAKLRYTENEMFSGVELPYGNGAFSMYVLLPNKNVTTDELIADLKENDWGIYNDQFSLDKEVHLELPKLKFSYERKDMKADLMALGMNVPFTGSADFSRISDFATFISRVIHKSFVEINEEGTEAAAVTAIEMEFTAVNPGQEKDLFYFKANKPFVFIIQENSSKTIMFIGKVKKPVIED